MFKHIGSRLCHVLWCIYILVVNYGIVVWCINILAMYFGIAVWCVNIFAVV